METSQQPEHDYQGMLNRTVVDSPIQRDVCRDDAAFAGAIAVALRSLRGRPTPSASSISTSLQGNLCEFCVWELGEHHWHLYRKGLTRPANALDPWRDFSRPGVDILAIDDSADAVFFIEVKSSRSDGIAAIASGENSLKADFGKLFTGSLEERALSGVNEMVAHLKVMLQRNDLAEKLVDAIGHRPEECEGAHLIGVLVCQTGRQAAQGARAAAFHRLSEWLVQQGWQDNQCECRCVELVDFDNWLAALVAGAAG